MSHTTGAHQRAQERSVRFIPNPDGQGDRLIITQKGTETTYWIDVIPHDFGAAAYRLEKQGDGTQDNDTYDVLLDGSNCTCSCPDFTFRGWKKGPCKHILACSALQKAGKLN